MNKKFLKAHVTSEHILQIIQESFGELFSTAFESILGLESQIEGKEDFFKAIKEKLEKLEDTQDSTDLHEEDVISVDEEMLSHKDNLNIF